MTYNFDPDRWYESHRRVLHERHRRGKLDDEELRLALADLERRYEEMLARLDGTYEIPGGERV